MQFNLCQNRFLSQWHWANLRRSWWKLRHSFPVIYKFKLTNYSWETSKISWEYTRKIWHTSSNSSVLCISHKHIFFRIIISYTQVTDQTWLFFLFSLQFICTSGSFLSRYVILPFARDIFCRTWRKQSRHSLRSKLPTCRRRYT